GSAFKGPQDKRPGAGDPEPCRVEPRKLQPPFKDLEVALLGLDDIVQERVDGGDLAVLVELVVERGELRLVLEPEDFHEVVRPAAVLVYRAVGATDGGEQRLQLAHEVEELTAEPLADRVRARGGHTGLVEARRHSRAPRP